MFPFDPPENIRKPLVFWRFQRTLKGTLGRKGLKWPHFPFEGSKFWNHIASYLNWKMNKNIIYRTSSLSNLRVISLFTNILNFHFLENPLLMNQLYKTKPRSYYYKRVSHASRSRTSLLQARLRETSNPKNAKGRNRKRRKLAHLLLWI